MGYGSNVEPDYIVPTAIANLSVDKASRHIRSKNSGLEDLVSRRRRRRRRRRGGLLWDMSPHLACCI